MSGPPSSPSSPGVEAPGVNFLALRVSKKGNSVRTAAKNIRKLIAWDPETSSPELKIWFRGEFLRHFS